MRVNLRRGFHRIVVVLTLIWLPVSYYFASHETKERFDLVLRWDDARAVQSELDSLYAERPTREQYENAKRETGFSPFQLEAARDSFAHQFGAIIRAHALVALGPPIAFLILGYILGWIIMGFRDER